MKTPRQPLTFTPGSTGKRSAGHVLRTQLGGVPEKMPSTPQSYLEEAGVKPARHETKQKSLASRPLQEEVSYPLGSWLAWQEILVQFIAGPTNSPLAALQ